MKSAVRDRVADGAWSWRCQMPERLKSTDQRTNYVSLEKVKPSRTCPALFN
jgi:hypothetical protein